MSVQVQFLFSVLSFAVGARRILREDVVGLIAHEVLATWVGAHVLAFEVLVKFVVLLRHLRRADPRLDRKDEGNANGETIEDVVNGTSSTKHTKQNSRHGDDTRC